MIRTLEKIIQQCDRQGRLRRVVAPYNDELLFTRAYLVDRSKRAYLHKFYQSDKRIHHNHPWDVSTSFVLAGHYVDHRINVHSGEKTSQVFGPGDINSIRRDDFHFLELIGGPVYTLFLPGERVNDGRDWGFWVPEQGFVPHQEYLGD